MLRKASMPALSGSESRIHRGAPKPLDTCGTSQGESEREGEGGGKGRSRGGERNGRKVTAESEREKRQTETEREREGEGERDRERERERERECSIQAALANALARQLLERFDQARPSRGLRTAALGRQSVHRAAQDDPGSACRRGGPAVGTTAAPTRTCRRVAGRPTWEGPAIARLRDLTAAALRAQA